MCSFIDSNVLVYMFDRQVPGKQYTATELVQQEVDANRALLSTQVLQEFYNVVTVKLKIPLPKDQAEQAVQEFSKLPVRQVDTAIIMAAIYRNRVDKISFWDALIIEAALAGGASILWSEDLQHGRIFDGLEVKNPFQ